MPLNLPVKVRRNGEDIGVFPIQEIAPRLNCWFFEPTDLYWHEGMPDWEPLSQFSDVIVRRHCEYVRLTTDRQCLELLKLGLVAQLNGVEAQIKEIDAKIAANEAGK